MAVMAFHKAVDFLREFGGAPHGSPADGLARDDAKPRFDLIQPRGVGGSEVDMIPGSPREPSPHRGMFVGRIVIHDQVHLQFGRNVGLDVSEKLQEFLMAMETMIDEQIKWTDIHVERAHGKKEGTGV